MSKINYHKNGHQHEAVTKTKRMLNKIEKQFGGFQSKFYCDIQLTGVNEIDRDEVKYYVERHLKELKKQIEKQLLQNEKFVGEGWNENYEEGFYMPTFKDELQLIEALNDVYTFIWDNYPDIEIKKSEQIVFKETTPEGKYNEAVNYFNANPVHGFNQEYFAVLENGNSKKLYPITFSAYDLSNATGVYTEFQ